MQIRLNAQQKAGFARIETGCRGPYSLIRKKRERRHARRRAHYEERIHQEPHRFRPAGRCRYRDGRFRGRLSA